MSTLHVPAYLAPLFTLTGELIERPRRTPKPDSMPPLAHLQPEEIANDLEELFMSLPSTLIVPSHGTALTCTVCGRGANEVPQFYLKHTHGLYALLCYDDGNGCWERSGRTNCTFVENAFGAQCMDLAEFAVSYGPDKLQERHVCRKHVANVLTDATVHHIFPLED